MAGAGQPWYMPVFWPVAHVTSGILKPSKDEVPKNVSLGKLDLLGHLTAICAALRSFILAYMAIYFLYDDFNYPAFGRGNLPNMFVYYLQKDLKLIALHPFI